MKQLLALSLALGFIGCTDTMPMQKTDTSVTEITLHDNSLPSSNFARRKLFPLIESGVIKDVVELVDWEYKIESVLPYTAIIQPLYSQAFYISRIYSGPPIGSADIEMKTPPLLFTSGRRGNQTFGPLDVSYVLKLKYNIPEGFKLNQVKVWYQNDNVRKAMYSQWANYETENTLLLTAGIPIKIKDENPPTYGWTDPVPAQADSVVIEFILEQVSN